MEITETPTPTPTPTPNTDEDFEIALLFVRDVMNARYPTLNVILNDEEGAAVMKRWGVDPSSAAGILGIGMVLAQHEGGHMFDDARHRWKSDDPILMDDGRVVCDMYYYLDTMTKPFTASYGELEVGDKLEFAPCGLTQTNGTDFLASSSAPRGISRSLILLDSENHKRPPKDCDKCLLSPHDGDGEWGSDARLAGTYLKDAPPAGMVTHYKEGFPGFDPNFTVPSNDIWSGGDQGFGNMFEEFVQYVGTLAWGYSRHDYDGGTVRAHKTTMLTFMWWSERYLKLTRENYPEEHALFMEYYAEPFLYMWGKAWRYLDTPTYAYRQEDWDNLIQLVTDDHMLGEIQYVRELYHGGAYQRGVELTDSTLSKDPDGITWEGPVLSGPPLIIDSESADGIYFATMPGGFTPVDSDRQGLADISAYIEKYDARLSVADGGYGNTAD